MNKAMNWKIVSLAMMLVGVLGAGAILFFGEDVLGTSDAMPWGSLISTYLFFAAASVGLTLMASLWYFFKIPIFEMITKRALYLAIISVLLAFVAIGLELGKPLKMIWLIFSPNFSSAIWWMGTLYALYLGFRMLTVYVIYKKDESRVLLFSRITVIAGLLAVSNLGSVFGNSQTRVFWQGAAMPFYFILAALLTGTAILIITYTHLGDQAYPTAKKEKEFLPLLGRLLLYFLGIMAFYKLWLFSNSLYGHNPGTYEAAMALLKGSLALQFWGMEVVLGLVIPIILLANLKKFSVNKTVCAAISALTGMYFAHNNFVVAGQIVPLPVVAGAPLEYVSYTPALAEWAIIIGAIGAIIYFSILVENKLFKGKVATVSSPSRLKTI